MSRVLVALATVWFTLAASWEMFGPILAGHYASSASMGIIAENMQHWRIWAPVWSYTASAPTPDLYYCHHPWGIFWTTRFFYAVLGRHDYVCRLPAVLLSAVTPLLLARTCALLYRPYAGAIAAVSFVVLPITLSFACFNALEVPVIAYSTLMLWGYVRLRTEPTRRNLAISLFGGVMAMNSDWPGFMLVGALLFVDLVSMVIGKSTLRGRFERRRAQWWVLMASAAVVIAVGYLYLFRSAGKLDDLLHSYSQRSAGNELPLKKVLESRRYWIELTFTPVAIALGKLAAVLCLVRFLYLRRPLELVPLAVLLMAALQYVIFREGADLHIFWPHYFGQYFAFGMAALTATLLPLLENLSRRLSARLPRLTSYANEIAVGLIALPLSLVLRDGVAALGYAHRSGGRFNEHGLRIDSEGDKTALLLWLKDREGPVALHQSMNATWAQVWALGGRVVPIGVGAPTAGSDSVTVLDARLVPDITKKSFIQSSGVTQVGPFWILDGSSHPPVAYSFEETEPSPWEWFLVSGTEPKRKIVADPLATWELQRTYGVSSPDAPAPESAGAASALEKHRILHNLAVDSGDAESAERELGEVDKLCKPVDGVFEDGTKLRCVLFERGVSPRLTIIVEPIGPLAPGVDLAVTSRVEKALAVSTTMADPTVREVGFPFLIDPSRFNAGWLYSDVVRIRKRTGREVYEAAFRGNRAPTRARPVRLLFF